MSNVIKIQKNVDEFYEPSESDEEYTEREKTLLKKIRKIAPKDDSEEEILPFDYSEEEEEDLDDEAAASTDSFDIEPYEANSDIENDNSFDNDIPDIKAWGKKRKDFYSTDFIDQDYNSYNAKEEQLAEQEEQEAKEIQQRLAKQLDEADFTLDTFCYATSAVADTTTIPNNNKVGKAIDPKNKNTPIQANHNKTHLKTDFSGLSKREQLQLFKKDSPEFDNLVDDFQQKLVDSENLLIPILKYFKSKSIKIETIPILDFTSTINNLILNYCTNISFYLVLKAERIAINTHPIVKRLYQIRELLIQLDDKYQRIIKPQLQTIINDINNGNDVIMDLQLNNAIEVITPKKLKMLSNNLSVNNDIQINSTENINDIEEDNSKNHEDERRQITYQIAKNKGLTPHRKKELRNPRVKHRNKFRKAQIRRKGAVRTVRKEVKRYTGEISGIKATVKKGIKIK